MKTVATIEARMTSSRLPGKPIMEHEEKSLEAFSKTFKGVDFSSNKSIFEAMSTRHPFYNGEIYKAIGCK